MLVLALDTSSAAVTAALCEVTDGVEVRAQRQLINARGHGENLAPLIAECVPRPAGLQAIVAGLGPGPYTGLRVGLVTAAVMGETLGIPTYGVCSLDGIAAACQDQSRLVVMADARRKEVYWACYDESGNRVDGPHVSRPQDIPLDGVPDIAGAGARLYADSLPKRNLFDVDYPEPAALVGWARDRILGSAPSETLTPLYLRRPDATIPAPPKQVSR